MQELKFRDDPAAMVRLMNAQNAIDEYVSSHPKKLSETERDELGRAAKGESRRTVRSNRL